MVSLRNGKRKRSHTINTATSRRYFAAGISLSAAAGECSTAVSESVRYATAVAIATTRDIPTTRDAAAVNSNFAAAAINAGPKPSSSR